MKGCGAGHGGEEHGNREISRGTGGRFRERPGDTVAVALRGGQDQAQDRGGAE